MHRMRKHFHYRDFVRVIWIYLGWWTLMHGVRSASLAVAPSTIDNQYSGILTLTITGIISGEQVRVDKFLDANLNQVVDEGDLLEQQFQLTDNQLSLIGGNTNINIPADLDPAAGSITTSLNLEK